MPKTVETTSEPVVRPRRDPDPKDTQEPGWLVICWNDPVNLMTYVTHVFMRVFGWNKTKAERHMLQVHEQGRSVLLRDKMERAEFYVHRLHAYGLHASMEKDAS